MLKKHVVPLLITSILLATISCEKMLFESPESSNTAVFEYIWQYTKDHYCCFDSKEVNWNEVYDIYAAEVSDDMEQTGFLLLMHEMLSTLEDKSVSITEQMGRFVYEGDSIYPQNLDTNTVKLYNPTNLSSVIYEGVGYWNKFNTPICTEINDIKDDISGIIIDLRGISELEYDTRAIRLFIDDECEPLGKYRYKKGSGDNDYVEDEIDLHGCYNARYVEPVIVLCNRRTLIDANRDAYFFSTLPNCTLIGDHTGGGNLGKENCYLANGWLLGIPSMTVIGLNGQSIGNGIAPDIYVSDDPATTDVDEIIEKALELLN